MLYDAGLADTRQVGLLLCERVFQVFDLKKKQKNNNNSNVTLSAYTLFTHTVFKYLPKAVNPVRQTHTF